MERKLFVLDLTSALFEIVVCSVVFDLRSVKRQRWSSFSPLSAQLSCQAVSPSLLAGDYWGFHPENPFRSASSTCFSNIFLAQRAMGAKSNGRKEQLGDWDRTKGRERDSLRPSSLVKVIPQYCIAHLYCARFSRHQRAHMSACSCKAWRICLDIELSQLKNGYSVPTSMGNPTFFLVIVINLS